MKVHWTAQALIDFSRLHGFLAPEAPAAAARLIEIFRDAAAQISAHPRIGQRVSFYTKREVRRIITDQYELRYEVARDAIYILRLWHGREDRPQ
jgi:plasmid stabilization system protein ParE